MAKGNETQGMSGSAADWNISRYEIPVRSLAEHVHRTGGLSSLSFSGISGAEGTRLHNRVFSDLKNQYHPSFVETEVSLTAERPAGDIILSVRGRADCVIHIPHTNEDDEITLIEIKSCAGDFKEIA